MASLKYPGPSNTHPLGLDRVDLCKATGPKCRITLRMNCATLDWMDVAVILSTFAFFCSGGLVCGMPDEQIRGR
jgi:hypothetical protein